MVLQFQVLHFHVRHFQRPHIASDLDKHELQVHNHYILAKTTTVEFPMQADVNVCCISINHSRQEDHTFTRFTVIQRKKTRDGGLSRGRIIPTRRDLNGPNCFVDSSRVADGW